MSPAKAKASSPSRKEQSATSSERPPQARRVIIKDIVPQIDGGDVPIKRVVGETITVTATIFTDGHEKIAADLLYREAASTEWLRAPMVFVENDRWRGAFPAARNARYEYTVEAWRDPFASWVDEVIKKRVAGADVSLETGEGVHLVERASGSSGDDKRRDRILADVRKTKNIAAQLATLTAADTVTFMTRAGPRHAVSQASRIFPLIVERSAARFGAWYELFPRSQSDDPQRHGTLDDVIAKLPYVRDLGFDVLYFPPIHPIGVTNRKGRNNSLKPAPDDPGSVYAIGGKAGGHTALHPELGSLDDFRRLVAAAKAHGLEIALDFAVQCSPDHPWIKEHPDWFEWRPDGTIKFAENPPKKYEDIVNVRFNGPAYPGVWFALRDAILFWVDLGVKIFRIDNPHTKPIPFWAWLIETIDAAHPDVLFLAEAFTRPAMMRELAKIGFQQSYTYFTWRNTKTELTSYLEELAAEMGEYYNPNFFVNTPDINPFYLQTSGRAGFIVRATLAATLSSLWGVYSGFELCEATPLPGREEYLDSEKYEIKAWDWDRPGNIKDHIRALNTIRRAHPALHTFRNILFLNCWNDQVIAYARMTPSRDDVIVILVNLDPHRPQTCTYEIPLWEFGLPDDASIEVEDLLLGIRFTMQGKTHQIHLDPLDRSVVIWRLLGPQRVEVLT